MARIGTDIIEVARVQHLTGSREGRALRRWFSAAEIAYCSAKAVPSRHFAARLAAKEAVLKALPGGHWPGPVPWADIEIVHHDDGLTARLAGDVLALATRHAVSQISVSLSHCDDYACAVALVESLEPTGAPE
jgi:holo-[acyl-carrier protein] synthase